MIYVGIDPGRKTGLAVWDSRRKVFMYLITTDFWGVIHFLDDYRKRGAGWFTVVIENPNLNKPTFKHKNEVVPVAMKRSQDIGRNKEDAYLLIEYCKIWKLNFKEVRPTQTKWNREAFKKVTGYQGSTNEHNRDAGRLVFGIS